MNSDEIVKMILEGMQKNEKMVVPISQIDTNEILTIMGKIRAIGLSATITSKGIEVKPKKIKKSIFKKKRLKQAYDLLLKSDPVLFPSSHPRRDLAMLKYWGIYGSEIDGELWISLSKDSIKKSKKSSEEKNLLPKELEDAIYNEVPTDYQTSDPATARKLFLYIKRSFGSLQLLRVKQLGSIISLIYKPKLPLKLVGKFKDDTVIKWARELSSQIGVNSACIAYNLYIKDIKGKTLSISNFKNLVEKNPTDFLEEKGGEK